MQRRPTSPHADGYHQKNRKQVVTGCGEKGALLQWRWERKMVPPLWRTGWRGLKKLKIERGPRPLPVASARQIRVQPQRIPRARVSGIIFSLFASLLFSIYLARCSSCNSVSRFSSLFHLCFFTGESSQDPYIRGALNTFTSKKKIWIW